MPNFPTSPLQVAQQLVGALGQTSSQGGVTQENSLPNYRPGTDVRHIMHWFVPDQTIVQMYINPQNVTYNYNKSISSQRTKGGFTLQYWGANLTSLRLSGTTGTSGVEGINVLYDLYNSEQESFDPYALFLAAQQNQTSLIGLGSSVGNSIGGSIGSTIGSVAGSLLQASSSFASPNPTRPAPSLAQLAFTIELYWSGWVFRGYFQSFNVTESAENLGMFNYDIEFIVTQRRGFRQNFLPWHRSPNSGPSNSDPQFGTPYSFGSLVNS